MHSLENCRVSQKNFSGEGPIREFSSLDTVRPKQIGLKKVSSFVKWGENDEMHSLSMQNYVFISD